MLDPKFCPSDKLMPLYVTINRRLPKIVLCNHSRVERNPRDCGPFVAISGVFAKLYCPNAQ